MLATPTAREINLLTDLFEDYTFRVVLFGTSIIGACSGGVGCFAYLRKQSLIGDVISHSSLLGIMVLFLLSYLLTGTGSKSLWILMPGALLAGTSALLLTRLLFNHTKLKSDTSLGVMLAIFFGSGVMLLRWVQRASDPVIPGRRGLNDYLFGMAAAMTTDDLWMIGSLAITATLTLMLCWKEFKIYVFDSTFTHSIGYRTTLIDNLLLITLVIAIVIGIQAVGVVLMIALLITPASTARQWTKSLGSMVILSAMIGVFSCAVGCTISANYANMPTGPVIVLVATAIFLFSLLFAPQRGIIARALARRKYSLSIDRHQPSEEVI